MQAHLPCPWKQFLKQQVSCHLLYRLHNNNSRTYRCSDIVSENMPQGFLQKARRSNPLTVPGRLPLSLHKRKNVIVQTSASRH